MSKNINKIKSVIVPIVQKFKSEIALFFKKPYKASKQDWKITELIIFSVPISVCLGLLYLSAYFSKFDIDYMHFFRIEDCIGVLYEKGVLFFFLASIFWVLIVTPLLCGIFLIYKKNVTNNEITNKKLIIRLIIQCSFICFFIYLLYRIELFSIQKAIALFLMIILSILLWLYGNKLTTIITITAFLCYGTYVYGEYEALLLIDGNKNKNRMAIILKGNEEFLSDKDTCKYLIRMTNNFIFVKDSCNGKVYVRPTSEIYSIEK